MDMSTAEIESRLVSGNFPIELPLGDRHTFIRLGPRISVMRYVGDVLAEHIEIAGRMLNVLERHVHSVCLTDCTNMGKFTPEARRALAALQFDAVKDSTLLLATAGADVVRRASMTIAITAAKLTTPSRIESMFEYDYDRCVARSVEWLEARPEPR